MTEKAVNDMVMIDNEYGDGIVVTTGLSTMLRRHGEKTRVTLREERELVSPSETLLLLRQRNCCSLSWFYHTCAISVS